MHLLMISSNFSFLTPSLVASRAMKTSCKISCWALRNPAALSQQSIKHWNELCHEKQILAQRKIHLSFLVVSDATVVTKWKFLRTFFIDVEFLRACLRVLQACLPYYSFKSFRGFIALKKLISAKFFSRESFQTYIDASNRQNSQSQANYNFHFKFSKIFPTTRGKAELRTE